MIFLLTTFGGLEQHIAQATNMIYFIPTAISAIIVNYKNKKINTKLALFTSVFGALGAIIGANISVHTDVQKLRKLFGIFLLAIAIHEIYTLIKQYKQNKKRHTKIS